MVLSSIAGRARLSFPFIPCWQNAFQRTQMAVPWGTASLLPREQHEPVYYGILPTIRRTDAVVASEAESKTRSHMNTEMRELTGELTDEELNRVAGGKVTEADTVPNQIFGAIAAIPVFGTALYAGYAFGSALGKLV